MSESLTDLRRSNASKTPDDLNKSIQVTNPGAWVLMTVILAVLIGSIIWGTFGTIESTVSTQAFVRGGTAVCIVDRTQIGKIVSGMTIRINGVKGTVRYKNTREERIIADVDVPDGTYYAEIVTNEIHPISLISN